MGVSLGIVVVFIGIILQGMCLELGGFDERYLQDQMLLRLTLEACILVADSSSAYP